MIVSRQDVKTASSRLGHAQTSTTKRGMSAKNPPQQPNSTKWLFGAGFGFRRKRKKPWKSRLFTGAAGRIRTADLILTKKPWTLLRRAHSYRISPSNLLCYKGLEILLVLVRFITYRGVLRGFRAFVGKIVGKPRVNAKTHNGKAILWACNAEGHAAMQAVRLDTDSYLMDSSCRTFHNIILILKPCKKAWNVSSDIIKCHFSGITFIFVIRNVRSDIISFNLSYRFIYFYNHLSIEQFCNISMIFLSSLLLA